MTRYSSSRSEKQGHIYAHIRRHRSAAAWSFTTATSRLFYTQLGEHHSASIEAFASAKASHKQPRWRTPTALDNTKLPLIARRRHSTMNLTSSCRTPTARRLLRP